MPVCSSATAALLTRLFGPRTRADGVGARLKRGSLPAAVLRAPINITAQAGDVFLFNSEFLHDTPKIMGESARTVFNSFAGWSRDHGEVELYA